MNSRDNNILEHIIGYCDEIGEAQECFGNTLEKLKSSKVYRNAVSMCILQIGELTNHLSDEFKQCNNEMPWKDIVAMRNIAAHHYGSFDTVKLWETISEDIPLLRDYCEKALNSTTK